MFQLLLYEPHKRLNGTVTADVKLGLLYDFALTFDCNC